MPRYAAFLRAINVGGHTVKMETLVRVFIEMGLVSVETFIASGNVIFEADDRNTAALERRIEQALHAALGYPVSTFVRTPAQIAAIARYQPFPADAHARAVAFVVGFVGAVGGHFEAVNSVVHLVPHLRGAQGIGFGVELREIELGLGVGAAVALEAVLLEHREHVLLEGGAP